MKLSKKYKVTYFYKDSESTEEVEIQTNNIDLSIDEQMGLKGFDSYRVEELNEKSIGFK